MSASPAFPPEPTYTSQYFRDEVLRLREAFGTRAFWSCSDAPQRAVKALGYVYLRVPDLTERDIILWESTLDELHRREALALLSRRGEPS